MTDESQDMSKVWAVAGLLATNAITNGAQYAGHSLDDDMNTCRALLQHEARHQQQECAIKLLDCENNLGGEQMMPK